MWLNINQILKLYVEFEGKEERKGEEEKEGNTKIKSEQTAYDRDDVEH